MEFNARYALIGLFTLLVISAGFVFVYWLNTIGGLQQRDYYKIRFETPVLGLSRGSRVLYNGLHIGEVSGLDLDFKEPGKLYATISIKSDFPIRSDTHVGIDYQSLTGGAAIVLTGVGSDTEVLRAGGGEMPLLVADAYAGASWIQAARSVLTKLDKVLNENAPALKDSIANVKTFTDVLSRNSDKVENILAGLERFAGGVKDNKKDIIFDLSPPLQFPATIAKEEWTLVIGEPTVSLAFNTDKIMTEVIPGQTKVLADGRWSDNLPNLMQTKFLQSFENAGLGGVVSKSSFGEEEGFALKIDVRRFHLSLVENPEAIVQLFAKVTDGEGKVRDSRMFVAKAPAKGATASEATEALEAAFQKIVVDIMSWVVETL